MECEEYARCGTTAPDDVKLTKGRLFRVDGEEIPHYMEEQLRKLGLPTKLEEGKVVLLSDHIVCSRGQRLTSDQAKILVWSQDPFFFPL